MCLSLSTFIGFCPLEEFIVLYQLKTCIVVLTFYISQERYLDFFFIFLSRDRCISSFILVDICRVQKTHKAQSFTHLLPFSFPHYL